MKTVLRPLGHRIIVKPDEVEKTSPGGIVLVQDEKLARFNQQTGTLVAIGEDAWKAYRKVDENGKLVNGQPWAKVGDKVMYSRNAGKWIKHPDTQEEFVLMNDEDLGLELKQVEVVE
jgi:co-chaperonin GroES (HSP10)